jgi:homoprotocatechuate degradation regulator HpaR
MKSKTKSSNLEKYDTETRSDAPLRDYSKNLPMALLKAREAVMSRFRPILREHNITEQQWRVIRLLYGSPGLEISVLSTQSLLLMPSLTRIIRSAEERGWVTKVIVEGDNRRRLVTITEAGKALYEKIAPLSEAQYKEIEAEIDPDNLENLYKILASIAD